MTGAYLKVYRDGWKNIEVEHLTDEEREELFINRTPEELVRWLNVVCKELSHVDNELKRLAEKQMNEIQKS